MFATNPQTGKLERTNYRYCYRWSVYREQLMALQARYAAQLDPDPGPEARCATDGHTAHTHLATQHESKHNRPHCPH